VRSVLYLGCPVAEKAEAERALGAVDVSVVWADTAANALAELGRHGDKDMPVLLDLSRGAAILQIARELRTQRAALLMFAVVDARRPDLTTEAVLAGMADVFARPLGGRRVANAIEREHRYETRATSDKSGAPGPATSSMDDLYGHSPAMRDVMALISRAASMRAGVMIKGEEGTGRQVAARAIHTAERGGAGAFVTVNCGAYEDGELDAELFGNGSVSAKTEKNTAGLERVSKTSRLFEARNGTVYLQNIVEAPTRVQARLARLLRDREAVLAEGGDAISLDVRPMAGVDPEFDKAVAEGRVRDDLVKRLSIVRIDMPPLRSRREDIPALANCFLREICGANGVPPKTLSRPALALISALPWRGNAAELRALLEGIVNGLQGGRNIGLEDVLMHVRLDGGSVVFSRAGTLKQARASFEREFIAATLEHHHGRISDTARALGIQRTNLYRKLRALRIKNDTSAGSS